VDWTIKFVIVNLKSSEVTAVLMPKRLINFTTEVFSGNSAWSHQSRSDITSLPLKRALSVVCTMLFTTLQIDHGNNRHLPQRVTLSGAFVFLQVGSESPRGTLHNRLEYANTASYKVPRLLKNLSDKQYS